MKGKNGGGTKSGRKMDIILKKRTKNYRKKQMTGKSVKI